MVEKINLSAILSSLKKFINIEILFIIVLLGITLYYIIRTDRKKYPFLGNPPRDRENTTNQKNLSGGLTHIPSKEKKEPKKFKHEERCREIFQQLFGVPFKSVRPAFLKNPVTNNNLEIDMFNPDIITPIGRGLGCEYDGIGHSTFSPHFHRSGEQEFNYQVQKDRWKDAKLKKLGILLIRVPHTIHFTDLERYIRMRLKQEGMNSWFLENRGINL